ncbi:MAG: 3-oxoacyl-ACP synthase III [Ilumatobacteraceae bacterium]
MTGSSVFAHHHCGILGLAAVEAPVVVTSAEIDEQLAETFRRNGVRPGLLADVAGIVERRWWDDSTTFADAAAMAGRAALAKSGIDASQIGLLISTSVCKDRLEPSMACEVHDQLGLGSNCLNFDLGNACLGFMNAMHVAAMMIDTGHVDYALIVDGEGSRDTQRRTIERLSSPSTTTADVFAEFASLTLGSGAAAMVLGRTDRHPDAHKVVGGIARAATQHHRLCVGTLDRMTTDTAGLLTAGLDLAREAWDELLADPSWSGAAARYVLHQVSKVHTSMLTDRLGIDIARVPLSYPLYGNIGPAAVPFTLARHQDQIQRGERVFCMGIGSGLNTSLTEIIW